ncbi:MAG: hypothetical protein K8S25_00655 [Alphaproteobacteria bacterium]|nr:hypothetical protein [Alphaproteobacteria bacterium]
MTEYNRIAEVFAHLGEPLFLVRESEVEGARALTLHTMERRNAARLAARAQEALRRDGSDVRCRVVAHNPRSLRRIRSLEALSRRFGDGRVVYDPTGFVGRSEAVADCARRLRASLGDSVRNIYLDTSRRTLYVIVKDVAKASNVEAVMSERAELVRRATTIMQDWQKGVDARFALAVRIGTEPPRGLKLVSVDAKSVTQTIFAPFLERKGLVRGALAMGAAALLGTAVTVPAAADPAVSAVNGSIIVRGGQYDLNNVDDGKGEGEILGKVTFPLGQSFGAQVEGGVGFDEYYGAGGHLFWRDPSWAMAGAFVSYDNNSQSDLVRVGAEADFYLGNFTVGGRVGHQSGDFGEGGFGNVDVSFYVTPNLAARAGVEFEPDDGRDTTAHVGFEWQPAVDSSPGLSVFADGEWGDDYDHVRAGLKIHFGTTGMTLIDRERKADPEFVTGNRRSAGYGPTYEVPAPAPSPH